MVVTHNIPSARAIGDELALLAEGSILARGTAAELDRSATRWFRRSCDRKDLDDACCAIDWYRRLRGRGTSDLRAWAVYDRRSPIYVCRPVRGIAEFAEVSGLQTGAAVRVNGMDAGEVTDIAIPPSPAGRFQVRMRLREDLRQLVRADSVASIRTDGIVGGRFVQIEAGSEHAPAVADGGAIKGREPFEFADLLERGTRRSSTSTPPSRLQADLHELMGL